LFVLDEIISYLEENKPRAWKDGHYPWQFRFEILHGLDDYTGFYYDTPLIGQIYGRSDTDNEKRGSCLPTSFEMAVEHLFPTPPRIWSFSPNTPQRIGGYTTITYPRSVIGKVQYEGSQNKLGELRLGGIRYPINQVMLHDIFRCNPMRMMSIINRSSLGLKIASNLNLLQESCRVEYTATEEPYDNLNSVSLQRLTLVDDTIFQIKSAAFWYNSEDVMLSFLMKNHSKLPGPVFETKDIRTWNIVRSLLQGRTPILTYKFCRPKLKLKPSSDEDGFPIYDERGWDLNEDRNHCDDFNPEEWPDMQGHAIVAIGLKKMGDELYFLINDPGPSLKMDIREGEFEFLLPDDPKLECGSQYWISESKLLKGRMSIDGLFEITRDAKVLDSSAAVHEVSEFRMGRKVKENKIDRIVIL
jgi:hypothetical protein